MTNCPNCGAPVTGPRCEYCDTVFDTNAPVHESIEDDLYDIDSLITDYSKEINELANDLAKRNKQLAALLEDSQRTFCSVDRIVTTIISLGITVSLVILFQICSL